jgi:tetratricopeptide (TPR) repeat protein
MRTYELEEIRRTFAKSADFNEIFDVFQAAIRQRVRDVEPYRLLFWNHSLAPDEIRLFGEKLASEFPELAYDVYLWLASVFEATYAGDDNYELAIHYYQQAAQARPAEPDPYLDACDCYDPDLNVPSLAQLIDFVRKGASIVPNPAGLYRRLAYLYHLSGDEAQSEQCRRWAGSGATDTPGAMPDPATDA